MLENGHAAPTTLEMAEELKALAAGIGGWALGLIGYQAGTTQQSAGTVTGIYQLSTLVPGALLLFVAVVLLLW